MRIACEVCDFGSQFTLRLANPLVRGGARSTSMKTVCLVGRTSGGRVRSGWLGPCATGDPVDGGMLSALGSGSLGGRFVTRTSVRCPAVQLLRVPLCASSAALRVPPQTPLAAQRTCWHPDRREGSRLPGVIGTGPGRGVPQTLLQLGQKRDYARGQGWPRISTVVA